MVEVIAMSRGPGKWQRILLAYLERYELVPVSHAVQHESVGSRADHVAARRAARALTLQGKVRAIRRRGKDRAGREVPLLMLTRPDSSIGSNAYSTRPHPDWYTD